MQPVFYLEHRGLRLGITRGDNTLPITRDQHVKLRDGDDYKISLQNTLGVKVDARIKLDGVSVGTVQLGPKSSCEVDRPTFKEVKGKFYFYKEGTEKAIKAKVQSGLIKNGEVEVTFVLEKERTVFACKSSDGPSWFCRDRSTYISPFGSSGDRYTGGPEWLCGSNQTQSCASSNEVCAQSSSSKGLDPYMGFMTDESVKSSGKLYSGATVLGKASSQKFVDVPAVTDVDFETTMILCLVVEAGSEEPVAVTHYFNNTDFSQPPPRVS